jgi:hypothetical protein
MADGWRRDESKEKRDPSATVGMADGWRRDESKGEERSLHYGRDDRRGAAGKRNI